MTLIFLTLLLVSQRILSPPGCPAISPLPKSSRQSPAAQIVGILFQLFLIPAPLEMLQWQNHVIEPVQFVAGEKGRPSDFLQAPKRR